jgi:hypothetical protein
MVSEPIQLVRYSLHDAFDLRVKQGLNILAEAESTMISLERSLLPSHGK